MSVEAIGEERRGYRMHTAGGQLLGQNVVRARVGEWIQGEGSVGRFLVSGPLSSNMRTIVSLFSKGTPALRAHPKTHPAFWDEESICGASPTNATPSLNFWRDFAGGDTSCVAEPVLGPALDGRSSWPVLEPLPGPHLQAKSRRALHAMLLLAQGHSFEQVMSTPSRWEESADSLVEDFFSRYDISFESNIPVGKGCSSSSADVLGLLSLLNRHFGLGLEKEPLYRIAAAIEPTDPLLDSQTVLFDSGTGRVIQTLPERNLALFYFDADPAGHVDTLADLDVPESHGVQRRAPGYRSEQETDPDDSMLAGFLDAWMSGDVAGICSQTTRSALASHRRRPRQGMDLLRRFALDHEAGLFVAHTGTLMGLLFPMERAAEIREPCERFVASEWGASLCMEYTGAVSSDRPAAQWACP